MLSPEMGQLFKEVLQAWALPWEARQTETVTVTTTRTSDVHVATGAFGELWRISGLEEDWLE